MFTIKNIAISRLLAWALATFLANNALAALPIQHWTQPSGAQVYLVESKAVPMVDVQIDFDAGSRRDPAAQAGLAGVTARMVDKGVLARGQEPALDENALDDAWADLGAAGLGPVLDRQGRQCIICKKSGQSPGQ
jgi:zinc protease